MRLLLFIILISLSGCSYFVKTVDVPVPVMCFKPEQLPPEVESAKDRLKKNDSDGEKIKQVVIERGELRKSDTTFRALFLGCST